jgi:hypothetical protein
MDGGAVAVDITGDIVGEASADVVPAAAESVAPSAEAALGCAARVSPAAGAGPRWCHGLHQSTPAASSTAAAEPAINGQGKLLTAGASVRSLTFDGCAADGLGACARDS